MHNLASNPLTIGRNPRDSMDEDEAVSIFCGGSYKSLDKRRMRNVGNWHADGQTG